MYTQLTWESVGSFVFHGLCLREYKLVTRFIRSVSLTRRHWITYNSGLKSIAEYFDYFYSCKHRKRVCCCLMGRWKISCRFEKRRFPFGDWVMGRKFSITAAILKYKILQSNQVKRTLQDSISELIIWKMNPLVVPVTGVKFKAAFLHA